MSGGSVSPVDGEVDGAEDGVRLDVWLAQRFPAFSRGFWRRQISEGRVQVDGRTCRLRSRLAAGQRVTAEPGGRESEGLATELALLYEDEWILAVNKPAGMPTHPLHGLEAAHTAFHAIIRMAPEVAGAGVSPLEGGLVHRLDTETSGVLVAARTRAAWEALREIFRGHAMEKEYVALVLGAPAAEFDITWPVAHHGKDRRKMCAVTGVGRPQHRGVPRDASSRVVVLERFDGCALVQVAVSAAQRHQIRVHLATAGAPLAGDKLYLPQGMEDFTGFSRHALHAARVRFVHPGAGRHVVIEAPLPDDFLSIVKSLRARGNSAPG